MNWEDLDEDFKAKGISSYSEFYVGNNQAGGLKLTQDEVVSAKLHMAEDGYGSAQATGTIDGVRRTVTTSDSPIIALAAKDEEDRYSVLDELLGTFDEIVKRFKDDIATSG